MVNKLTKEIEKKASGLTDSALKNEILLLGGRVQDTDYYYREPKRWQKYSAPLANEFVHLAFCESKDLAGCRATVSTLAAKLKEPRLEAMFDEQVTAEERA